MIDGGVLAAKQIFCNVDDTLPYYLQNIILRQQCVQIRSILGALLFTICKSLIQVNAKRLQLDLIIYINLSYMSMDEGY